MTENIHILILEDNDYDAELLRHELKKSALQFHSKVVYSKSDFEKALADFKPDIVLSDYSLPAFDAVSAFQVLQGINPDIPFIIVSGTIGEERAVDLIKNGVTDYTLKDKLFSLNQKIARALKEAEEKKKKRMADEKLRIQNEKLFEIAFLQSHQVRSPISAILGWVNLFNLEDPQDPINVEVIKNLHKTTTDFDNIVRMIVKKTNEIKAMRD